MKAYFLSIPGFVALALVGVVAVSMNSAAVTTNSVPASLEATEMARNVMVTAELAIKASERSLSVMMWVLGICLGGSTIGIAGLWIWVMMFTRRLSKDVARSKASADELLDRAGKTASVFEQVLCSLPVLFIDGIDHGDRVVAVETLAQLRRVELAPIFQALLKKNNDSRIQAGAVYALGLLERGASHYASEILRLSTNPDYNLRRECARALSAIGPISREIQVRLEEMLLDKDDFVKQYAKVGVDKINRRDAN